MQGMTLERAADIVGRKAGLPQGLSSFLHKLRGEARAGAELRSGLRGYDAHSAEDALGQLAARARRKLDLEQMRCSEYELKHGALLQEARAEQDEYAAQAASAKARILGAEAAMDRAGKGQAALGDATGRHRQKCALEAEVARKQLMEAEEDIKMMNQVVAHMNCPQLQAAALLQCRGRGHASLRAVGQRALRRVLAGARPSLRRAVRRGLLQAGAHRSLDPLMATNNVTETNEQPISALKQRLKCSAASGTPTCALMTDRILLIQTGIMDKVDEMKEALVNIQRDCQHADNNYNQQISNLEFRAREAQTTLAEGMTTQTQNDEQSRLKSLQIHDMMKDHTLTMHHCKANLVAFEHEICGIKRIRSELLAMSGAQTFVQDCEVSEWTPEECSVTCGGGVQKLKRSLVSIPSEGGTQCPPLEMLRKCSQQACPEDCKVGAWSRWSSCTAQCGGGVRQRARNVLTKPKHGGVACGLTTEVESCNIHACDKDCELMEWSGWSPCSRMCGGGLKERRRALSKPPLGEGSCADPDGPERLDYAECNKDTCELPEGQQTLRCDSAVDVILLLQGSASTTSDGFEAIKQAGELLVRAFADSNSRVGVVLFSGPREARTFVSCSRGVQPGEAQPDVAQDCGIEWVSHFSSDVEGVAQRIRGLQFPRGTTLTSGALTTTLAELRMGRPDARSVVLVLTNGRPMSPRLTAQAAALVRERARLLWVPITSYAPVDQIRQWSSKPVHENVIHVPGYSMLRRPETVSQIVSQVCPRVK